MKTMPSTSQTQHTPGPWIVRNAAEAVPGWYFVGTEERHEQSFGVDGRNVAKVFDLANARLIAAAPALLEALLAILPPDGEPGVGEWWGLSEEEQHDRIRHAICAARGGDDG